MSKPYEETFGGERVLRPGQAPKHEEICARLHQQVAAVLAGNAASRLLEPRAPVQLAPDTVVRPDLTLVTVATGKPWLVAEIIGTDDHRWDTVTKKEIYEEMKIPRLWMVDPRYNNVEIYHGTAFGLSLKGILAHREFVTEKLLPALNLGVAELFGIKVN